MSLPRWLLAFWHWLTGWKPYSVTWDDAVRVTDPARLAKLDRIYAEQVAWVRSVRPDAIQQPNCLVTLREWPNRLRSPFGIAKVLAPNVVTGDTGGTLLLHEGIRPDDEEKEMAHEVKHAITGEPKHPDWLFPNG